MQKMIIKQNSTNPQGMAACLEYTLFSNRTDRNTQSYGVSVKNELTGEAVAIPHITENLQISEKLFDLLLTGCVTPVSLKEVVEDFIVEN